MLSIAKIKIQGKYQISFQFLNTEIQTAPSEKTANGLSFKCKKKKHFCLNSKLRAAQKRLKNKGLAMAVKSNST